MKYTLRPATERDIAFIRRLHEASMRPIVEKQFGIWDPDFQRKKFTAALKFDHRQIIQVDRHDVGMINVIETPEHILLDQIWLLPTHQRAGIGTHIISELISKSRHRRVPIRLQVLTSNPAKSLYERLGFHITDKSETHDTMVRPVDG